MSPANFMVGSPAGRARRSSRLANGIARERRAPAERSMRMGRREDRGKNSRASTGGRQKAGHAGGHVSWSGVDQAARATGSAAPGPLLRDGFRQNGAILPKLKSKVPGTDGPLRR